MTGADDSPDAPDTDPLRAQNPWGAGGWGASYASPPQAQPAARADGMASEGRFDPPKRGYEPNQPVLGDVELPSAPDPFAFPTAPAGGGGRRIAAVGLGVVVLLGVLGVLAFWLINRSAPDATIEAAEPGTATPVPPTEAVTATAAPHRDPVAEAQLLRALPAGYPPGVCRPVPPGPSAVAAVDCGNNTDEGGPVTASYSVAGDRAALDAALSAAVRPADIVVCPGNIQSPGPWRRNARPEQVAGTLVCGMQGNVPTIAWTDAERMVLSAVSAEPVGPSLDQLYQWWSTHS